LFRIDTGQRQPRLMLPSSDVRLKAPFPRQIWDAAQMTVVEKNVSIVACTTTEDLAMAAIGQFDGGAEQMVLNVDFDLQMSTRNVW
jgi:hypothetical protein